MTFVQGLKIGLLATSALALSGCSILDRGKAAKEEASAAEKEGRITMVLTDERLTPDPDLVSEIITLPPPRALTDGWPQAGSRASKAVGHISAASNFTVAWRTSVGKGSDKKSALTTAPVASADTIFTIKEKKM